MFGSYFRINHTWFHLAERTYLKAAQTPPAAVSLEGINPSTIRVTWRSVTPSHDEEPILGYKASQKIIVRNILSLDIYFFLAYIIFVAVGKSFPGSLLNGYLDNWMAWLKLLNFLELDKHFWLISGTSLGGGSRYEHSKGHVPQGRKETRSVHHQLEPCENVQSSCSRVLKRRRRQDVFPCTKVQIR